MLEIVIATESTARYDRELIICFFWGCVFCGFFPFFSFLPSKPDSSGTLWRPERQSRLLADPHATESTTATIPITWVLHTSLWDPSL